MSLTESIIECVRDEGPIEAWRVAELLEIERQHVHGILQNLEKQERVRKNGWGEKKGPHGTVPPLWEIV